MNQIKQKRYIRTILLGALILSSVPASAKNPLPEYVKKNAPNVYTVKKKEILCGISQKNFRQPYSLA